MTMGEFLNSKYYSAIISSDFNLTEWIPYTKEEMETRSMKSNLGETYLYVKQIKNVLQLKGVQARLPYEMIIE